MMLGQFASHARNDIDTDESIGDQLVDEPKSLGKERRVVVPPHQAQHMVGARLEGDVEVRHELCRLSDELDNLWGQ